MDGCLEGVNTQGSRPLVFIIIIKKMREATTILHLALGEEREVKMVSSMLARLKMEGSRPFTRKYLQGSIINPKDKENQLKGRVLVAGSKISKRFIVI